MAKHDLGDMNALRAKLEGWLSDKMGEAVTLDELSFPEENGESSVTLLLNAHHGDQLTRLVCRMKPVDSQVFDSHDLALQYRLMEIAGEADIPVPELRGYEPDESLLGSDFYIMGFTDGQIPTDNPPYAFGSWVTELSAEQRGAMWSAGLEVLAAIHRIDIQQYDLPTLPRSAATGCPVEHELEKFKSMASPELRERMDDILIEAFEYVCANAPSEGERRLSWGDSRVGNVIWQDLKPAAVLDWEMASLADPLQDVAWWYWIDYVNSVGLGVERLSGLPELADVYERWHELTGLSIEHSTFYDLFCVVRYAIILEKKFVAMEAMGITGIGNFCVPFVAERLAICRGD